MRDTLYVKNKGKRTQSFRVFFCLSVVIFLLCFFTACSDSRAGQELSFQDLSLRESLSEEEKPEEEEEAMKELPVKIFVHVCGAVNRPGVYELDPDDRIFRAIEAAGGLTDDADETAVNQAGRLNDGQQIYIYTKDETSLKFEDALGEKGLSVSEEGDASGKINLNTATKEELLSLTGIGEAKADAIMKYRDEHDGFKSLEEIMNIRGIKEGVFQKIKDDITI